MGPYGPRDTEGSTPDVPGSTLLLRLAWAVGDDPGIPVLCQFSIWPTNQHPHMKSGLEQSCCIMAKVSLQWELEWQVRETVAAYLSDLAFDSHILCLSMSEGSKVKSKN